MAPAPHRRGGARARARYVQARGARGGRRRTLAPGRRLGRGPRAAGRRGAARRGAQIHVHRAREHHLLAGAHRGQPAAPGRGHALTRPADPAALRGAADRGQPPAQAHRHGHPPRRAGAHGAVPGLAGAASGRACAVRDHRHRRLLRPRDARPALDEPSARAPHARACAAGSRRVHEADVRGRHREPEPSRVAAHLRADRGRRARDPPARTSTGSSTSR